MAQIFANRIFFLASGSTTAGSSTTITRGVATSSITEADLSAAGVEIPCVESINLNPDISREQAYCPVPAGAILDNTATASYALESDLVITSKQTLTVVHSTADARDVQLMYQATAVAVGSPGQALAGAPFLEGLVMVQHYNQANQGKRFARAFFWTQISLTSFNMDQAIGKVTLEIPVLPNGTDAPVELFND